MGHGHHEPPYTIPSYKEFKIDGIPQLQELERALAQKGLKDPWIRNEAWRYNPGFGTRLARARVLFTRGMPLGIVLAAGTAFLTKALSDDDHHGHDGGHH
ncbi:NADH dehydrogenase [ubiquinone] 1 beta subcomplex subunit 3 [Pectinophora gossypiella]|uniref:NADH dehydrogenase [ubiquinone] 1 beta subcomplex subunit 3 n=1 Tax=Pectinophora gossypiella TaxID=13191 RepID=A0A1E1WKQ2_PECGO|nr:NADH dehydrogenase [ubiquinone] 1 beta subcomplex subunit 3 [Pectinophora gossypiella]